MNWHDESQIQINEEIALPTFRLTEFLGPGVHRTAWQNDRTGHDRARNRSADPC